MKTLRLGTIGLAAASLALGEARAAEAPLEFSQHGRLLGENDVPVNGTVDITLSFHRKDIESASDYTANLVWNCRHPGVHVTNGFYSLPVGRGEKPGQAGVPCDPLAAALFDGAEERWMAVAVNGDPEMQPRMQVGFVPWALRALVATDAESLGTHAPGYYAARSSLEAAGGTVNDPSNPLDWSRLKGVPAGLAGASDDDTFASRALAERIDGDLTGEIATRSSLTTGLRDDLTGLRDDLTGLRDDLTTETNSRTAGDTNTLNAANAYTDAQAANEVTNRSTGDTNTLNSAKSYADGLNATEVSNRTTGDTNTLNSARSYADAQDALDAKLGGDNVLNGANRFTNTATFQGTATFTGALLLPRPASDPGTTCSLAGSVIFYGGSLKVCDGTNYIIIGPPSATATPTSCKAIKSANGSALDGVYSIDPDGLGGNPAFNVYCDMSTDGGGWTYIARGGDRSSSAVGTVQTSVTSDTTWHLSQATVRLMYTDAAAYQLYGWDNVLDGDQVRIFRPQADYSLDGMNIAQYWNGSTFTASGGNHYINYFEGVSNPNACVLRSNKASASTAVSNWHWNWDPNNYARCKDGSAYGTTRVMLFVR